MKHTKIKTISCFSAMLICGIFLQACEQRSAHYTIGTGSQGATFYPLARALCTIINQKKLDFTCEAVSTPGSFYNLNAIENGEHDLALSQFNLQYQAYRGLNPFHSMHKRVATVVPLHQEIFILAVHPSSEIKQIADLKGKRVNIGNVGSGSRVIIEQLFKFKGWKLSDFEIHGKKSSELPQLLCDGKIDAAIYSTGHPNAIYKNMIQQCGVELVDLWDEKIAQFVAENWQFNAASIPANSYQTITEDKLGFGVQVVLSANNEIPAEHIYQIIQTIVEDQKKLAKQAPIFRTINVHNFPLEHVAPYHKGAKQYYQDQSLSVLGKAL